MAQQSAITSQTVKTSNSNAATDAEISYQIIDYNSWNIDKMTFGNVKTNAKQIKSIALNYGENATKFFLKVPRMTTTFGAQIGFNEKSKTVSSTVSNWNIQLSMGESTECQIFQKKIEEFDQLMIEQGFLNWTSWLGMSASKKPNREVVESRYTGKMLKYSQKDGVINTQYAPYIRLSFPSTFKEPYELTCEIYDHNSNLIPNISLNPNSPNNLGKIITAGCQCSALISGSIWVTAAGYGVAWKIVQLKFFPSKQLPKGRCLLDDPEDVEEIIEEECFEE